MLVYLIIKDIRAAFGQTLLALKIYSTRYVHYRFSTLIASARTHPRFWKILYLSLDINFRIKYMLINVQFH